jgi:hypothetical protein
MERRHSCIDTRWRIQRRYFSGATGCGYKQLCKQKQDTDERSGMVVRSPVAVDRAPRRSGWLARYRGQERRGERRRRSTIRARSRFQSWLISFAG